MTIQNLLQFVILHHSSSIGVCCPDEISDRTNAISLPEDGDFDAIVWGADENDESTNKKEAIVSRPEDRGVFLCEFDKI